MDWFNETAMAPFDNSSNIVLSPVEFDRMSNEELANICMKWSRKRAVELVVTDFRIDPVYVSVRQSGWNDSASRNPRLK
jgi:hypothetical protein